MSGFGGEDSVVARAFHFRFEPFPLVGTVEQLIFCGKIRDCDLSNFASINWFPTKTLNAELDTYGSAK